MGTTSPLAMIMFSTTSGYSSRAISAAIENIEERRETEKEMDRVHALSQGAECDSRPRGARFALHNIYRLAMFYHEELTVITFHARTLKT